MRKAIGGLLVFIGSVFALVSLPFLAHTAVNAVFVLLFQRPVPGWWWRLVGPIQNIVALPIVAFAFVVKLGPQLSLIVPLIVCLVLLSLGLLILALGLRMLRKRQARPSAGASAVVGMLLLLTVAACGQAPTTEPTVAARPGTLLVQWSIWGGSEHLALYEEIVDLFETQHPDITVQLVTVADFTNYLTKLQTLLAAGTPPDVMTLGNEWFPAFLDKGAFQNLTPYVEADEALDLEAYIPLTLEVLTRDGKLYALPANFSVDALYYNQDAFDEAGVPYPDDTWTWESLLDAAQQLTVRDESGRVVRYGWSDTGLNMWPWIWQNGGLVFDNERNPTRATLTDPAVVEAVQFYYDLSLRHKVAPNVAELQQTPLREMFMSGRVAMIYDNVGAQVPFAEISEFDWDVAMLAQGRQRATPMAENGYAMSADTANPDAAWTLIKFLSGPDAVKVVVGAGGAMPSLRALAESDEMAVKQAFLDSVPFSKPIFSAPQMLDMLAVFRNEQPLMAMGLKPVPVTLESMNEAFNDMLGAR
jgi:multiple sugar transport system substrate-binding protein